MHAAQNAPGGAGVIILHKRPGYAQQPVFVKLVGFQEKTAAVAEHIGRNDADIGQCRLRDLERHRSTLLVCKHVQQIPAVGAVFHFPGKPAGLSFVDESPAIGYFLDAGNLKPLPLLNGLHIA